MQQRRLRLGDILDDYCPRERRITNHAVVAMIDDEVKQTRCTTCDADHEYKAARVPPPRRKRGDVVAGDVAEGVLRPRVTTDELEHMEEAAVDEAPPDELAPAASDTADDEAEPLAAERDEGEVPVHRRLIRATLPRPEGQPPERKEPDFTIRQHGGSGREFDGNKTGPLFGHGRRLTWQGIML